MLQSPIHLAVIRMPLAEHFLHHFDEPPWHVVAGGQRRSYTNATLPKLENQAAKTHGQRLGVHAILPDTGGYLWHFAVRASIAARPAQMKLPPSMIVSADELFLLWRLNEPVRPKT